MDDQHKAQSKASESQPQKDVPDASTVGYDINGPQTAHPAEKNEDASEKSDTSE